MSCLRLKAKKFIRLYCNQIFILFLWVLPSLSFATPVYKSIDRDGNVIYSDQPRLGSEPIILSVPKVVTPPPTANNTAPLQLESTEEKATQTQSYTINITEPTNESVFTTEVEKINVNVSIQPELSENDYVVLKINDKIYDNTSGSTQFILGRLDRGSYKLQAFVYSTDNRNKSKGQSEIITIHQIRAIAKPTPL